MRNFGRAMHRKVLVAAAAGAAMLSGCLQHTQEWYNYVSTPDAPQTVTLKDIRTGEALWTAEVPVGKKLYVAFSKRSDNAEAAGFDQMQWDIVDASDSPHTTRNVMKVPPPSGRRLDVTLRQPGELAPGAAGAATAKK